MGYRDETEVRGRILAAVRDAYPGRSRALAFQIDRWFAWWWAGEPPASHPGPRCRFCARMLAPSVCRDCLAVARAIVSSPETPLRDMIRTDVLRALRVTGDEVAIETVDRIARLFPDLRRVVAPCGACTKTLPGVGTDSFVYCDSCISESPG